MTCFRKAFAVLCAATLLGLFAPGAALAATPPLRDVVLTHTAISPSAAAPGAVVHVSWCFDTAYADQVRSIELWLGHSTGMGHAPYLYLQASIDPKANQLDFIVPAVPPSQPGNIWFVDLVWRDGAALNELALVPITIQ
ncbi:hypothetical protein EV385_5793 [Krasilnikovia cinnamomea]|uniref:Ig-like domain-containing protein n=1 Tax=Krasilnikovia cinnamomea TaxID=349313 RepID=A0A4Q7ZTJ3_9ACTN|nr:hypothetical protein [Krasilnikovia cinnamomea]RZU53859.1 hypothetical protein EV385_5793 [Krasilnikovia cinnamomea]